MNYLINSHGSHGLIFQEFSGSNGYLRNIMTLKKGNGKRWYWNY